MTRSLGQINVRTGTDMDLLLSVPSKTLNRTVLMRKNTAQGSKKKKSKQLIHCDTQIGLI